MTVLPITKGSRLRRSQTEFKRIRRGSFVYWIACIATITTTALQAQDDDTAAEVADADAEVEVVVVTGSRIERDAITSTSPVIQITNEEVEYQGLVRVEDMLRNMPQIWSSQNTGQSNGATGTATVNLRNLGSARTLVLVNGRRLPIGSPLHNVASDINQIPGALINRVEVLTGGASSTYGSDAVAGVVNFVMDDSFEGLSIDYQLSQYWHNNDNSKYQELVKSHNFPAPSGTTRDGGIEHLAVVLGANMADGRGNVTAYATYRDIDAVNQASRDYSACAFSPTADSCWGSSTIPEGRITNFQSPDHIGFDFKVNGSDFVPRAGTLFNYGPLNYFQRPDVRHTFGAFAHYAYSDTAEIYGELMFMDDHTVSQIAPSGAFFVTSSLNCGNPFLSDQQYNLLTEARLSSDQRAALDERLAGMTPEQQEAYLDGAFCQDREDDTITAYLGRRNVEGGPRQQDLRHTSFRMVVGTQGELGPVWSYDINTVYSQVSMENTYLNDLGTTKIKRALDAVHDDSGNVVCRSVLDGSDTNCAPWNIFQTGGVSQEAINYLVLPLFARGTTEQKVLTGYVSADLGEYDFRFPGAGTGISVVAGIEHREESLDFSPDEGYLTGEGAGQGGATTAVGGGYNVSELFVESSIPLVEGAQWAEELLLDAGYRYSTYSGGENTHSWGFRGSWTLNYQVRGRASVQRAVRAPSVRELFQPQGFNLFDMDADPCGGDVTGSGPSSTVPSGRTFAECQRTGVTAAHWGNIQDSPAGQYNFLQGGNPDLGSETATTWSYGVIWTPANIRDLSASVDWFSIEIEDGISILGPEFVLNQCLDGNDDLCNFVKRSAARGDLWIGSEIASSGHVVALDDNLAIENVSGLDLTVNYEFDTDRIGSFSFHNVASFLLKWDQQEVAGAEVVDCNGIWGGECGYPTPSFQNNLRVVWDTPWDRIEGAALWRHIDATDNAASQLDLDAVNYVDMTASWEATETTSVRVGINNLFDVEPPVGGNPGPSINGNGNIFPGMYDGLGRYLFIGVGLTL